MRNTLTTNAVTPARMPADVAAPHDAATISETTLDYIRRELHDELQMQQRELLHHTDALEDVGGDDDRIDAEVRRQLAAGRQRARDAIADIRVALARLEAGTYGTCDRCGSPIAAARLEALPTTKHCISCAGGGRA